MRVDADCLVVQVDYGYQLSGENLPLIGCIELNNETEPIILR